MSSPTPPPAVQLGKLRPRAGRDKLQLTLQVRGGQAQALSSDGQSKLRPHLWFSPPKDSWLHLEARGTLKEMTFPEKEGWRLR